MTLRLVPKTTAPERWPDATPPKAKPVCAADAQAQDIGTTSRRRPAPQVGRGVTGLLMMAALAALVLALVIAAIPPPQGT